MRSSRTFAAIALVLMLMSALPALCLPLASMGAPPPVCHQHHGPMPSHNCCRSTPSSPAALQATFHEATLDIVAPVVTSPVLLTGTPEPVLPSDMNEFSSPPLSVLRI
jgi:hypothetical protein